MLAGNELFNLQFLKSPSGNLYRAPTVINLIKTDLGLRGQFTQFPIYISLYFLQRVVVIFE